MEKNSNRQALPGLTVVGKVDLSLFAPKKKVQKTLPPREVKKEKVKKSRRHPSLRRGYVLVRDYTA
jgi:hypothetical protein